MHEYTGKVSVIYLIFQHFIIHQFQKFGNQIFPYIDVTHIIYTFVYENVII